MSITTCMVESFVLTGQYRSCTLCRSRKVKCNRELPCNNCVRAHRKECVYEDHPHLRMSTEPCASERLPSQPERQCFDSTIASTLQPLHNSIGHEAVSDISIRSPVASDPYSFTTLSGSSNSRTPISESSAASINLTTGQNGRAGPSRVPVALPIVNDYNTNPTTSGAAELCNRKDRDDLFGRPQIRGRLVIHKSRLFGQSHWMNGCDSVSS